jgi:hypothetical protein
MEPVLRFLIIGNKKNRFAKLRIAGDIFRRFLISASHRGLICRVRSPHDVAEASIFIEKRLLPPYYSDIVIRGYIIRTWDSNFITSHTSSEVDIVDSKEASKIEIHQQSCIANKPSVNSRVNHAVLKNWRKVVTKKKTRERDRIFYVL